jgi:hypothetical protein
VSNLKWGKAVDNFFAERGETRTGGEAPHGKILSPGGRKAICRRQIVEKTGGQKRRTAKLYPFFVPLFSGGGRGGGSPRMSEAGTPAER